MAGLKEHEVLKEICDLKHKAIEAELEAQKAVNEALWEALEAITNPATGHIAVTKQELEKKIDKQDSRLNGLIISIITTITGIAVAIGSEFIKKFVK